MKTVLFTLLAALLAAQVSQADDSATIDPVVVSPDLYEVILENEHVRIVQYRIDPGERDEWHTHPAKVSIVSSGGDLRIMTGDGESFDVTEEVGAASWMNPLGKHFAENIGDTPVQVVLVEVKSASAGCFDHSAQE